MKVKKRLFPFLLMFAILFTLLGIVSINITFSKPIETNNYDFNVFIDNISSENIDVYNHENTFISYSLLLDKNIKDYYVTFDVINDSSFKTVLSNIVNQGLPDELKNILDYSIEIKDNLDINERDHVTIKYKLKNNLTNYELELIDNYNIIGINVILNYSQK